MVNVSEIWSSPICEGDLCLLLLKGNLGRKKMIERQVGGLAKHYLSPRKDGIWTHTEGQVISLEKRYRDEI